MNEHQASGTSGDVGYNPNVVSPGGSSPGNGTDRDRFTSGSADWDQHSRPTHAALPHRMETPRDETIRAGQHHYRQSVSEAPEWYEDTNTLSIAAGGIVGGMLLGWLLGSRSSDNHREREWDQRWEEPRYIPERSYQPRQEYAGRRSYGSNGSVATDETRDLIASDKVEGTAVYDRKGSALGPFTTSWSASVPVRWPMPSSALAAGLVWAKAITRFRGLRSPTTLIAVGTSSASRRRASATLQATRPTRTPRLTRVIGGE